MVGLGDAGVEGQLREQGLGEGPGCGGVGEGVEQHAGLGYYVAFGGYLLEAVQLAEVLVQESLVIFNTAL